MVRDFTKDWVYKFKQGAGFPWGGTRGSLTAHSPLQSATLLSQHYHYLRLPNLHVLLRFTLSFVYKVYIGFLSRMRGWTVAVNLLVLKYSIFENMAV